MENITIGTKVDIKRSDGRIHEAMVSGINSETNAVTVEWFEKGETKGKEIDFEQLFDLNPNLQNLQNLHNPPIEDTEETQPGPPVVNPRERLLSDDEKLKKKRRQTNIHSLPKPAPKPVQNGKSHGNDTVVKNAKQKMSTTLVAAAAAANGIDEEDYEDDDDFGPVNSNGLLKTGANATAGKRKSNTVQEIERLKKNREQRRAKQEDLKQQKQELMNLDPGNPNWEFMAMIKDYRDKLDYHPLKVNDAIEDHQICVCVRKRPMNKKEHARKEVEMTTIPNKDHVIIHQPQTKVDLTKFLDNQTFRFDYAFDENASNEMVYRFTAQPLVKTIFDQGFATCFAYGQTGSGKTHTMGGDFQGKTQEFSNGIYAMTARDVFRLYHKSEQKNNLVVSCSFFEIYSGKVFDLLNNKAKLRILEDGKQQVQVCGLQEIIVNDQREVLDLIKRGSDIRTAGQTSVNSQSSRSHAIFQIILRKKGVKKLYGKFSVIDLAGNERGADTMSSNRTTRMEGAEINKSLLALKECIRALGRKNAHLPFRASKLTLVLRDSFIGDNARTCMIAMISPGMNSVEHTLNTLRYADRVKELGTDNPEVLMKNANSNEELNLSESSDLALLHSHNEEELSEDLYNLQMAMDQMQEQEEKLLDEHSKVCDDLKKDLDDHRKLLKLTETVDYDTEAYAETFRGMLDSQINRLIKVRDLADGFLGQLQQEEIAALKAGGIKNLNKS